MEESLGVTIRERFHFINHIIIVRATFCRDTDIAGSSDYSTSTFTTHESISNCFPCIYIPYIIDNDDISVEATIITSRIQRLYYSKNSKAL
jgi:hypothetical protein